MKLNFLCKKLSTGVILANERLVVKDNALIGASYNLDINEQRLLLMAIYYVRETGLGITCDMPLFIRTEDFAQQFGLTKSNAYKALRLAINSLFDRQFSYHTVIGGCRVVGTSRWVSNVFYSADEAFVGIVLAHTVIPFISRLEINFTSYALEDVSRVKSKYAIRLFELLMQWKSVRRIPSMHLDVLRNHFGLEDHQYTRLSDFKAKVLKTALDALHENSNYRVKVTDSIKVINQVKGTYFDITFSVAKAAKQITDEVAPKFSLSDKQKDMFADKLIKLTTFSGKYAKVGESYPDFKKRVVVMLDENEKLKEFLPYLNEAGFSI